MDTKSSIRHLYIWSYSAEVRPYRPNEKKLDFKIINYHFVDYFEKSRNFKFMTP